MLGLKLRIYNLFSISNLVLRIFGIAVCIFCLLSARVAAQEGEIEFNLDVASSTIALPRIFQPNIDLSGRGYHADNTWPQTLAAKEVLDTWQKDIGFSGLFRLQYNLWEINTLSKDKAAQERLLNNYEEIIKNITDSGGIVLLDIFGTPPGFGRALDKKSPPYDFRVFKALIKGHIRRLSCEKRYNIWYEVWSAPDLDEFFLGRKQEYLNLYRTVAEAVKELEAETKVHILLGGPSTSWWFHNADANSIVTPERSLIYELIHFCYSNHLPLDFITWHGYATDPQTEKELTVYKKPSIALIREWLSYFNFDKNTPLIVAEWNYDNGANVLPEREEKSNISSSYILSRLKNMYEAGLNYQLYFCLEDFQNNKEGIVRNTGLFKFDSEASKYKGAAKPTYNVFKMLSGLGNNMFVIPQKNRDEFTDCIATKKEDTIIMLIYNYSDPNIAENFLSRHIATLNPAERKTVLNLIRTRKLEKILLKEAEVSALRATNKVKILLKTAQDLHAQAAKFSSSARGIKITIKNLKENYLYQRYTVDASCSQGCEFSPSEEKEINAASGSEPYQESLTLGPYSVQMIVLKKKPPEPQAPAPVIKEQQSSAQNITNTTQ